MSVPLARRRSLTRHAPNGAGRYVLYWMTAYRRTRYNFALQRAVELAREWDKPLLVLEALRVDYPFASDRLHRFVLDGMRDLRQTFARAGVTHHTYVEASPGAGQGLLTELSRWAVAVVGDDAPTFFLPLQRRAAAAELARLGVAFEAVDSNGLFPLRDTTRVFTTAHSFRRHLQRELPAHLVHLPRERPLLGYRGGRVSLPKALLARWPAVSDALLEGASLERYPIDHHVGMVPLPGGEKAAQRVLRRFVRERLRGYAEDRNHPDVEAASGLSPYLHFGHVSSHEVFREVVQEEGWEPSQLGPIRNGARQGFWGMSESAEAFLDQLVTWRELGFNAAAHQPGFDRFTSLPEWARKTLGQHSRDPRPQCYSLRQLETAETHDEVWNAAQRELLQLGTLQNYLRMLWGKKILEWSPSPEAALDVMLELNDKYALDGRDPNSVSGIFWVLGRYDRPWGPVRPIFGAVRYMSSDNTRRKLRLSRYLERFGPKRP